MTDTSGITRGKRALINQAIDMIERQDMSHWSDAHDRVVVLALREFRTVWCDEQERRAAPASDGGKQ